jgi:DNA-binding response OmpR family regulator
MNHSILVVDDEIDICETIADTLSEITSDVVQVQSVGAALAELQKKKFHLVISDIMMPDMNGLDFLKTMRQQKINVPLIFISASDAEESLIKALQYGATDFISKPFQSGELIVLVKHLLSIVKATAI